MTWFIVSPGPEPAAQGCGSDEAETQSRPWSQLGPAGGEKSEHPAIKGLSLNLDGCTFATLATSCRLLDHKKCPSFTQFLHFISLSR